MELQFEPTLNVYCIYTMKTHMNVVEDWHAVIYPSAVLSSLSGRVTVKLLHCEHHKLKTKLSVMLDATKNEGRNIFWWFGGTDRFSEVTVTKLCSLFMLSWLQTHFSSWSWIRWCNVHHSERISGSVIMRKLRPAAEQIIRHESFDKAQSVHLLDGVELLWHTQFSPLPTVIPICLRACAADAHTASYFDVLEVAGLSSSTKQPVSLEIISH